jgi:hypothetical protein
LGAARRRTELLRWIALGRRIELQRRQLGPVGRGLELQRWELQPLRGRLELELGKRFEQVVQQRLDSDALVLPEPGGAGSPE